MFSINWLPTLETPAAYVVLLTAALLLMVRDWRILLGALLVQYGAVAVLWGGQTSYTQGFAALIVGLFIGLMLYVTIRQTQAGQWPQADTPPSSQGWLLIWASQVVLAWLLATWLALSAEALPVTLAFIALALFGGWRFFTAAHPLLLGLGGLMLTTAAGLFWADGTAATPLLLLTITQLIITLTVSYLAASHKLTS